MTLVFGGWDISQGVLPSLHPAVWKDLCQIPTHSSLMNMIWLVMTWCAQNIGTLYQMMIETMWSKKMFPQRSSRRLAVQRVSFPPSELSPSLPTSPLDSRWRAIRQSSMHNWEKCSNHNFTLQGNATSDLDLEQLPIEGQLAMGCVCTFTVGFELGLMGQGEESVGGAENLTWNPRYPL